MRELEKVFVADAILTVKREILKEDYITWYECNHIANLLAKRLKENGYDIHFSLSISDKVNFGFAPGIIYRRSEYVPYFLHDHHLKELIYDKQFIQDCLYEVQLERLVPFVKHNCMTCNSECTSTSSTFVCDRWCHNITMSSKGTIKK